MTADPLQSALNHLRTGQIGAAEALLLPLTTSDAMNPAVHSLLGMVAAQQKRFADAVQCFERAIELDPQRAGEHFNLGKILLLANRTSEAIQAFENALQREPSHVGAALLLADAYLAMDNPAMAVSVLDLAKTRSGSPEPFQAKRKLAIEKLYISPYKVEGSDIELAKSPDIALALRERAEELSFCRRYKEALQDINHALMVEPNRPEWLLLKARCLENMGDLRAARASVETALTIDPMVPFGVGSSLWLSLNMAAWDSLDADRERLNRQLAEPTVTAANPFTGLLLFDCPNQQSVITRRYSMNKYSDLRPQNVPTCRIPQSYKKIRVGYFSADFREHPVAHLITEMIGGHDREKFEVLGFGLAPSASSQIACSIEAAFDNFIDVSGMNYEEIARCAADSRLDVGVDLMGHTRGARFGAFIHRVAPLQISFLGFPGTTGHPCMDYLVGDRVVFSEEVLAAMTEKPLTLPGSFMVADSRRARPTGKHSRSSEGLPENVFVFCCFNQHRKILPETFALWMSIIQAVPESVLWLARGNALSEANLLRAAEKYSLAHRIIFAERKDAMTDHLDRLALANLILDTFPYGAHTTASDALWVGVPVLSKMGKSMASRVGASLLTALGLTELIVETADDYRIRAIEIAQDKQVFAALKTKLNRNLAATDVFDGQAFARKWETALQRVIEENAVAE